MSAVAAYIRAGAERDPAARAQLLEACCAADVRMVTRSSVIRGRAGIEAMLARFLGDPQNLGFRLTSAVDAVGSTFRYRSVVIRRDGSELEFFDAGELDGDGKIVTLLVFAGPLA
ncbi:MAG TPA: nuclear transport factor 2 family protein [Kofleriaceae bacterium]